MVIEEENQNEDVIKLAIADNHWLHNEGICAFFQKQAQYDIVFKATTQKELFDQLSEKQIDVLLIDLNNLALDTEELVLLLEKWKLEKLSIIILTMHQAHDDIRKSLEAGINGYLLKTVSKEELLNGIEAVSSGNQFYQEAVQKTFMHSFNADNMISAVQLTRRELETLELLCQEYNTEEIAEKLFISKHTVASHRKNLLTKTGARNSIGLARFAFRNKFVEL